VLEISWHILIRALKKAKLFGISGITYFDSGLFSYWPGLTCGLVLFLYRNIFDLGMMYELWSNQIYIFFSRGYSSWYLIFIGCRDTKQSEYVILDFIC